jgi:hypothetical protein
VPVDAWFGTWKSSFGTLKSSFGTLKSSFGTLKARPALTTLPGRAHGAVVILAR